MTNQLMKIDHIVHLMLENRSLDHMLGFLYTAQDNRSPAGDAYDGLTGEESNPVPPSPPTPPYSPPPTLRVPVFAIDTLPKPQCYFMLGTDPGEGFDNYNLQLFGTKDPPDGTIPDNQGFVANFQLQIGKDKAAGKSMLPWTKPANVMGIYTSKLLPILSGLAKGYAVCDGWFSSGPIHTWPNRAFAAAGTSQGCLANPTVPFTCNTVFDALTHVMKLKPGDDWAIFGPLGTASQTRIFFETLQALDYTANFGDMADFAARAKAGTLPAYTFIEPDFGTSGDSQHPDHDVARGEQLIHSIYYALRANPDKWASTLLVITYDEHGGTFDHAPPPGDATPPNDGCPGEGGFDFTRFGVRVPAVLVSPRIEAGTVFRAPDGETIDHTSLLRTIFERWGGRNPPHLTDRDKVAPSLAGAVTLDKPRPFSDDPIAGIDPPVSGVDPYPLPPQFDPTRPSMLDLLHAGLVARLPVPGDEPPPFPATAAELRAFVIDRVRAWDLHRQAMSRSARDGSSD